MYATHMGVSTSCFGSSRRMKPCHARSACSLFSQKAELQPLASLRFPFGRLPIIWPGQGRSHTIASADKTRRPAGWWTVASGPDERTRDDGPLRVPGDGDHRTPFASMNPKSIRRGWMGLVDHSGGILTR